MQLISFSAHDFRSIKSTPKLLLSRQVTVLLGPNNEGKSNVLRGFATAMQVLSRFVLFTGHLQRLENASKTFGIRIPMRQERIYDWKKDFPIALQATRPTGSSKFVVEFELTPQEIVEFKENVGSNLNGTLPVEISAGPAFAEFRVLKQGRGAQALSRKASQIARFIGRKLDFHYIPAVRTSEQALKVVDEIVEKELRSLEGDSDYVQAIKRVEQLQAPVLKRISENLGNTLRAFLPDVTGVDVRLSAARRYAAFRRSTELLVNDGTATDLSAKGDGVQSLAAISLIRHAVRATALGRSIVLAVEEPESHIHPGAMTRLRDVLDEIASQHQVIITTHNPIFVQKREIPANIIVERQKARPAVSLDEIRESLGVRIEDNLRHSEVALIVEGEEDRIAMSSLIAHHSPILKEALHNNRLGIDTLGGGRNLCYKLTQLRMGICDVHVLLDDDDVGRESVEKAIDQSLLELARVTLTRCKDMKDAELEDWYDSSIYEQLIKNKYGDIINSVHYKQHRAKWSCRIEHTFLKLGKPWSPFLEMEIKHDVASLVAQHPENALKANKRAPFDGMISALEERLAKR